VHASSSIGSFQLCVSALHPSRPSSIYDTTIKKQKVSFRDRTGLHEVNKDGRERIFREDMAEYRTWFSHQKEKTRNSNALKLKAYCDWIGKTPQELLTEYETARKDVKTLTDWKRDTKNKILEFYNMLKSKNYAINTCRSTPLGILRFYHSHAETVENVTEEFDPVQLPENEFAFTQDVLRKVYYYGDTEEKALCALAVSLGYASVDFVELEAEKMRSLVSQAKAEHLDFIGFIGKTREKTSVQPRSFLTPEAIESLGEYLELLEKKNGALPKYLFGNGSPLTNQGLNKKIKRMFEKANINTYGKDIRFHSFRKFLFSRLQQVSRDMAKIITGKKCDPSIITYIPDLDAEAMRVFRETYKAIALNGDITGKAKQESEKRIADLENSIRTLTSDTQALRTQNQVIGETLEDLIDFIAQVKQKHPEAIEDTKSEQSPEMKKLLENYKLRVSAVTKTQ
jgi:integrase